MIQDSDLTSVPGASGPGGASAARQVGPWRILGVLGEGGMGVVYLAERSDGAFDRQVALKLLRPGLDAGSFEARFLQERRTLAALEHPNIAQLLDAGRSSDGLPYFAMERVEGESIDAWCQSRGLSLNDRIGLFLQVCDAVQYAHGRLIVHRDIKPSNVLVDTEGRVRLLDFGIAKLLDDTGDAALTRASERLLTPQYAAPEQLLGDTVGVGADVYALGMLLYLLLADELPYRLAGATAAEQHRLVCESNPPPPSSVTSDPTTAYKLRGDLDQIVLMALRKEPTRRYASADQLSADLKRWQQGLPISARADTIGYRARRFVKRNRLGVAAASLVFLSLAVGLAASLWQASEAQAARELAEQRYRDVRGLANALLDDIDGLLLTVPGATKARRVLVERALGYLEGLAVDGDDDLPLLLELGAGHERIAEILGSPYEPNLGDLPGATLQAKRSLELRQRAAALQPDHPAVQLGLARSKLLLAGLAYATNEDLAAIQTSSAEVVAQLQPLMQETLARADTAKALTFALNLNGDAHNSLQDFAASAARHREALEVVQSQLADDQPRDPFWRRMRAVTGMKLAHAEWWLEKDPEEVIASMTAVLDELEQLHQEDPGNARIMRLLAHAHANVVNVVNVVAFERNVGEALPYAQRALELGEQLVAVDPGNAQAQRDNAGWQRMARNLYETGQYWDEADREVRRALETYQTLMRESPENRSLQADWQFTQCERAIGLLRGWEAGHRTGAYGDAQRCEALEPCMAVLAMVEAGTPPQPREADRYERLRNLHRSCQ